eukprot:COSAG06_NODE_2820_length_6233_cov_12.699463_5_plen_70_part_00
MPGFARCAQVEAELRVAKKRLSQGEQQFHQRKRLRLPASRAPLPGAAAVGRCCCCRPLLLLALLLPGAV